MPGRAHSLLHRHCPHPRAKTLTNLGALACARGLTVLSDATCINPHDAILHDLLPVTLRVTMWMVCGAAVIACAQRPAWHPLGFGLAALMPAERAVGYAWSVIAWAIPGEPAGSLASIAWLAWWAGIVLLIRQLARWPEPPATP